MGKPRDYVHPSETQFTPQKLGCLPIRQTLLIVCVIGLVGACLSTTQSTKNSIVSGAAAILLHSFVLFAVYKENACMLKWSQRLYFVLLVISILVLAVLPLMFACNISSGLMDNDIFRGIVDKNTLKELQLSSSSEDIDEGPTGPNELTRMLINISQKSRKEEETERRFIYGVILGLACEIGLFFGAVFNYMVYVMIKRFKNYVIATNKGTTIDFEKGQPLA
ncbi:hypothetical protein GCK72_020271 [Caenorhabditis remanei]|uniref:Uncharacterized protein n=1 Tax=Caenorhabditis remanei TaxID=31234 RepID=E3LI88_CAERE|nr:hypothetical protein GCK72_020271 [Caenorhabditis remanei]EFO95452.1 hypothetical protein CRE_08908 [Caenorhabditis remanei]KAF1753714.1 hypothetical protein GCK72_020271 [Caenorhabditis remanei]